MNEPYRPIGWPDEQVLMALVNGIDTSWTFDIASKYPPRQIREMFGEWRMLKREAGPLAVPTKVIPQKVVDATPPKILDNVAPDREWFCQLRCYAIGVEHIRRVAVYTTKYVQDNRIWQATFKIANVEKAHEETTAGLRQALIQFSNALGLGP